MQEWIIAMLIISMILIIRDMAKTILLGRAPKVKELLPLNESHPQKEKVQDYAVAFQKLADAFYGMPYRRDYLNNSQIAQIEEETKGQICGNCYQREICWGEHREDLEEINRQMLRGLEVNDEQLLFDLQNKWRSRCGHFTIYLERLVYNFFQERQKMIWENHIIENRLAVAYQLTEMSQLLGKISEDLYDVEETFGEFRQETQKKLKKHHILLKKMWIIDRSTDHKKIFLTIKTKKGYCVSVKEAVQVLSEVCKCAMTTAVGSRCVINGELHTIQFIEEAGYRVLCDSAKLTREKEKVSGDTCSFNIYNDGKFLMCLSDGMGSGRKANKESELAVELVEEFIKAGFSQETAARMVNTALLFKAESGMFSTLDLCTIDLYTGMCYILKAGASATFIKRDHWVEVIESESIAAGILQKAEFETVSRKLYHGEYLIMITDGVLDALPLDHQIETMKDIIMDTKEKNPKEISRGILERVLGYSDYKVRDDMTVLVAGIWKK